MFLLKLIPLILLGFLARRIYLALKPRGTVRSRRKPARPGKRPPSSAPGMDDLTEQDISDADFEEIP